MLPWDAALPDWLVAGVVLGALLAGLVAAAFVVGTRRFPDAANGASSPADGTGRGSSGRRRAEIRDYLRSIGEPFVEDRQVAGRTVAFYLPDREVAVTFDARDYFVLDRAGVRVVLVEYELPGGSLGARLPFETPRVEPVARPVARAFARLGLPPSASESAVRSAYRERVKAVHPDHGGGRESFDRLREAYLIARERAE